MQVFPPLSFFLSPGSENVSGTSSFTPSLIEVWDRSRGADELRVDDSEFMKM